MLKNSEKYSFQNLAYIGDAVFELRIREKFLDEFPHNSDGLHKKVVAIVNGISQSNILEKLRKFLNDEEIDFLRAVRNNKHSGNSFVRRESTSFEALLGNLYVCGEFKRLNEIIDEIFNIIRKET
jgi:ribonuclease-3 family protein